MMEIYAYIHDDRSDGIYRLVQKNNEKKWQYVTFTSTFYASKEDACNKYKPLVTLNKCCIKSDEYGKPDCPFEESDLNG